LEEFGSQLAQLRERLNELDRAVTALSDHLANQSHQDTDTVTEVDGDKFVDMNTFAAVQGLLAQLQQEHERLIGTAAHLSHELDINKEHVKVKLKPGSWAGSAKHHL
jgi:chromosome segregation ATPase